MEVTQQQRAAALRFIVCLGIVSLFADMTYEGAASIVGPFLKGLGATGMQVGLIAGLGEMIAASLRYFSGRLVDRTRAYWAVAIMGYFLNVVVVPAMAFAGNWQAAALLIVIERTGKSLRGPARDVLLSEATGKIGHGWGFGVHAAMDQTGAMLGPLLMAWVMLHHTSYAPAYLKLAFPAAGALIALLVGRAMYPQAGKTAPKQIPQKHLPKVFWMYTIAAGVLACGFVDYALLSYHFQDATLVKQPIIPLLFSAAMGLNGLTALIFGKLFDRYGIVVLSAGTLISMFSLPLGFLGGTAAAVGCVVCWATGMGAQDACLRSGISQVVSMNKRGSAFGAFNGVFGIMWFIGSAIMGVLYDRSLMMLVIFGMTMQLISAILFLRLREPLKAASAA